MVSLPVCRLAFEHGEFTPESTQWVAQATCMYISGMFAQTGIKIMTQAFYPIQKARWPFWAALANMLTTAGLNLSAFLFVADPHTKFLLFPLATSVGALVNFLILLWGFARYGVHLEFTNIFKEIAKIIAATAGMGLAAWLALDLLGKGEFPGIKVTSVFLPAAVGALVYWSIAKGLKTESLEWIKSRKKA